MRDEKFKKTLRKYRWVVWLILIGIAFNLGVFFTSFMGSESLVEKYFPQSQVLVKGKSYAFSYDMRTKNPSWIMEILKKEDVEAKEDRSKTKSEEDTSELPLLTIDDYRNSGFDSVSLLISSETTSPFLASSPQYPAFATEWTKLNDYFKDFPKKLNVDRVLVITEPLFLPPDGSNKVVYEVTGKNNIAVPTHFFRAIFYPSTTQKSLFDEAAEQMPGGPSYGAPVPLTIPQPVSQKNIKGEVYLIPNKVIAENVPLDTFRVRSWEEVKKIPGIVFPDDIGVYLEN